MPVSGITPEPTLALALNGQAVGLHAYATEGLKADAAPGTLVRSETANDYALPPRLMANRIL
jgi:hypothetical protein